MTDEALNIELGKYDEQGWRAMEKERVIGSQLRETLLRDFLVDAEHKPVVDDVIADFVVDKASAHELYRCLRTLKFYVSDTFIGCDYGVISNDWERLSINMALSVVRALAKTYAFEEAYSEAFAMAGDDYLTSY